MKHVFTILLQVYREKHFSLLSTQCIQVILNITKRDLAAIQAVTMEDVKAVYEKYIKGKNFVETSFVPKGAA